MLTSATTSGFQTIIFNTEPVSVAVTLSAHIREVFGSDLSWLLLSCLLFCVVFLSPSKQMLTSATTSGFQTIIFNTEPVSVAVTLSAHIREVFRSDLCRGFCYPVCCFA
jgi:hypothetical protein